MSLKKWIAELKSIKADAETLFAKLTKRANEDKKARKPKRAKVTKLADRLAKAAKKAARARLDSEISDLQAAVARYERVLQISGLETATRESVKDLEMTTNAKLGRLEAKRGMDFSGLLTEAERKELTALVAAAKEEAQTRKKAAEFLASTGKIADMAFKVAGKLAA